MPININAYFEALNNLEDSVGRVRAEATRKVKLRDDMKKFAEERGNPSTEMTKEEKADLLINQQSLTEALQIPLDLAIAAITE